MSNCSNCHCIRKAVSVNSDVLIKLDNGNASPFEPFCFVMCSYCSPQPTVEVLMELNTAKVPLWDKYGRPVFSNQLEARKVYKCRYVEEGLAPHVTVGNVDLEGQCCARTTPVTRKTVIATSKG